ncbi:hypothetical protein SGL43_04891 [Streptomyces globisporus]|uniref:Uncharacterized protein n=1 Tax=Streptomyces globisporus TaxID=1908 RepID=A0ABM9H2L6_STRGL|nr:hypothetical protein SGL43_04891 [Streptomyces globisporus]
MCAALPGSVSLLKQVMERVRPSRVLTVRFHQLPVPAPDMGMRGPECGEVVDGERPAGGGRRAVRVL